MKSVSALDSFLIGLRAFNEANVEELLSAYAPEATWLVPCARNPLVRGRRAVARQIISFKGLLPESRIGVRRAMRSGDWLVIQTVLHGTHRWNAQGIERPPIKVGYEQVFFVNTDQNAKAAEVLLYYDQAALRRQLGVMSGPAPPVPNWPSEVERIETQGDASNAEVVKKFFTWWEKGTAGAIDEIVAEGFVLHDRATGQRRSLTEFTEWLDRERETDSVQLEIEQTVIAGPYVAVRYLKKLTTLDTATERLPAPLELHGACVFRFDKGKIAALETYTNELERLVQVKEMKKRAANAQPPDAGPEASGTK